MLLHKHACRLEMIFLNAGWCSLSTISTNVLLFIAKEINSVHYYFINIEMNIISIAHKNCICFKLLIVDFKASLQPVNVFKHQA